MALLLLPAVGVIWQFYGRCIALLLLTVVGVVREFHGSCMALLPLPDVLP